ncbi:unnamed protein product [Cladocopium goreaui]|uniref:Ras-related protein Rab-23 n=1 Tax=Cladocopium goreaui TaxID=2562237 RepID=A0A9P1FMF0_9DINO|nr:unnamed protein product [Cladocopium goreaui]
MPPRRPGASKKDDLATLATLATLPDFVDPDEAVVSSWFADYKSEETSEGSVAWLAEVASNPQRSDRLGVGATPAKVADQPAKELQPLGKAARKAMNRRLRREKEEAEYALQGQRRLQKLGGNGASSDSEEDQGRAARPGTGAGSARRGDPTQPQPLWKPRMLVETM